jgi:hypothetical protein
MDNKRTKEQKEKKIVMHAQCQMMQEKALNWTVAKEDIKQVIIPGHASENFLLSGEVLQLI